jgi:hypothetical protein
MARSQHNYREILEELGYFAVIDAACTESEDAEHVFFSNTGSEFSSLAFWKMQGIQLIAEIPLALLQSLLDDSLCRKVLSPQPDKELAALFDNTYLEAWMQGHAVPISPWVTRQVGNFAPAIYTIILADSEGRSPSPNELRRVIRWLRRYISGDARHDAKCVIIDNQSRQTRSDLSSIQRGLHYHLAGKINRVKQLVTFWNALSTILDEEAPEVDGAAPSPAATQPFRHHLKYFGFTKNTAERSKGHESGSTNWLKALVFDICKYLFNDGSENCVPTYTFHTYTVAYPVNQTECKLGEELLCRIANGYHYTGLGFNMQDAGVGTSSAALVDVRHGDVARLWEERVELRNKNPCFEPQILDDEVKFLEYRRRIVANDPLAQVMERKRVLEAELKEAQEREPSIAEFEAKIEKLRTAYNAASPNSIALRKALSEKIEESTQFIASVKQERIEEGTYVP